MKKALKAAQKAVAAGDHARALHPLLDAWRELPHPRVAALVEAVGALATKEVAPVAGTTEAAREKAWRARAKAPEPEDVGALVGSLAEGVKVAVVGVRIEQLSGLDPDPRVASCYVAMLRAPPSTASSHKSVWTEVLRQLREVHVDPRAADAVAALAPDYTRVFGDTVTGRSMQTQLTKLAGYAAFRRTATSPSWGAGAPRQPPRGLNPITAARSARNAA